MNKLFTFVCNELVTYCTRLQSLRAEIQDLSDVSSRPPWNKALHKCSHSIDNENIDGMRCTDAFVDWNNIVACI